MKKVTFNLNVCIYTFDETKPIVRKKKKLNIFQLIKKTFLKKYNSMYANTEKLNKIQSYFDDNDYDFIDYDINLDLSLKENSNFLFKYFRKSWNISIIVLLFTFCYIYFTIKPLKYSKF